MFIQGALTNIHKSVSTDEFLRFLAAHVPGNYFMVQPPPGINMTAAIDWRVVLQDVTDITPFASALWSGYETFITPLHNKDSKSSAGIFVQMKNEKGEFDQFMIGKDILDKEALNHRMEESTKILCLKNKAGVLQEALEETKRSGYWIMAT
ncbi:MAG: hypothetical protein FD174_3635 [Geobacteraceae bacterium]|nr:MAG: hypothetical protein FD174_3635 [Geobacteraceae bacterium]